VAGFDPSQLLPLDLQLAESWRRAGAEMGVRVTAPFELAVGVRAFQYGALVAGFGTVAGVLLRAMPDEFHPDQCGAIWSEAAAAGYTVANLSPLLCRFDRDEFAQFLNMFEWCGPADERPTWHTGPPTEDQGHAGPGATPDRGGAGQVAGRCARSLGG
jgi:hypothetical protein